MYVFSYIYPCTTMSRHYYCNPTATLSFYFSLLTGTRQFIDGNSFSFGLHPCPVQVTINCGIQYPLSLLTMNGMEVTVTSRFWFCGEKRY